MVTQPTPQPIYGKDFSVEKTLADLNTYIIDLARKYIPRAIVPQEVLDLEIDDLAQNTRIKFWFALQKGHVKNQRAYLRSIVFNEAVNLVRKHKPMVPLIMDEDGEIHWEIIGTDAEDRQNPLYQIEQEDTSAAYMKQLVDIVVTLPLCQRSAMICALKDRLENIIQLADALRAHKIDIETISWPDDEKELRSYKSSLSVARSKVNSLLARL